MSGLRRGRPGLFWIAFVLVLCSAGAIGFSVRTFLDSLTPLWVSSGLSAVALVLGVLAASLPGRRDG